MEFNRLGNDVRVAREILLADSPSLPRELFVPTFRGEDRHGRTMPAANRVVVIFTFVDSSAQLFHRLACLLWLVHPQISKDSRLVRTDLVRCDLENPIDLEQCFFVESRRPRADIRSLNPSPHVFRILLHDFGVERRGVFHVPARRFDARHEHGRSPEPTRVFHRLSEWPTGETRLPGLIQRAAIEK